MTDREHVSDELLAELVTRPAAEALDSAPFRRSQMALRSRTALPDGYIRYQSGPFFVDVSPWGLIAVRQDDWLSKFSAAIEGTTAVEGRFARVEDDILVPIANENWIETGELLVYLPAYRSRLSEQDGLKLRIGDRDVPLPKPSGKDPAATIESWLRAAELQRQSESGEITDRTMEKLRQGDVEKALGEGQGLTGVAAAVVKGVGREQFSDWALAIINKFLAEDPDLPNLDEMQKQVIFQNEARKSSRILVYEFMTGSGPQERTFDETHILSRDIRDGHMGQTISEEIGRQYATAAARSSPAVSPMGDVNLAPLDFRFKPVSVGFGPDRFLATADDVRDPDADPIEAIIGSYDYGVDVADYRMGPRGIEYAVTLTNRFSLWSLFAHGPALNNFPRQGDLEKTVAEEEKKLPYATTTQIFKFYSPVIRPDVASKK